MEPLTSPQLSGIFLPMRLVRPLLFPLILGASFGTGCRPVVRSSAASTRPVLPPLALPAGLADSVQSTVLPSGAVVHTIVQSRAPWRAIVLEADLRCHTLQAVKGHATAVGRTTTSGLLTTMTAALHPVGAVNADFFLFAPPGVPTNAHVERHLLISGPDVKPVVWVDAAGRVVIDTLRVTGQLTTTRGTVVLTAWNRPAARSSGVLDARWGVAPDTVVRRRAWRLVPLGRVTTTPTPSLRGRFVVREWTATDSIARGDTLMLHLAARERDAVRDGDTVTVDVALHATRFADAGVGIREAVGGRPILVADSAVVRDTDTEGNAGFRGLNPRTALGIDRTGRRVWLAVIDGRQPGFSMGMTLTQTADLMRALGAVSAINLDGGGSSALAIRDAGGSVRVLNRPSDKTERPVANALALLSTCH